MEEELLAVTSEKKVPKVSEAGLLRESELEANLQLAKTMLYTAGVVYLAYVLSLLGLYDFGTPNENIVILVCIFAFCVAPGILCLQLKGDKPWIKTVMMIDYVLAMAVLNCILSVGAPHLIILPIVLSVRYYSPKFTHIIMGITMFAFTVSGFINVLCGIGFNDLNRIILEPGYQIEIKTNIYDDLAYAGIRTDFKYYLFATYLPQMLIVAVISEICAAISKRGKKRIEDEAGFAGKTARIESELSLATDIQANMLPSVFPAFPDLDEFDLYAKMSPAKEVGGDFYDFFMVDDKHIALVIADVSGKGVPAALFMVTAKTLIKDHIQMGLTPAEAFTRVNSLLCEENETGMFVTAWCAVIDITTGKMTYVNAGHNPPLYKSGSEYSFFRSKPSLFLAGIDGTRYLQGEITLKPGDRLFLYTDGITEAVNVLNGQYGEERLVKYLNAHSEDPLESIIPGLRSDIDKFVGAAKQFDDITMLAFKFKGSAINPTVSKEFEAIETSVSAALSFIEDELSKLNVPKSEKNQILSAAEEIIINIVRFAYPKRTGNFVLDLFESEGKISVRFKDSGIRFNPLSRENPDITLSVEERPVGGLGIYMVKQTMDDVNYVYKYGMNILTIVKTF